LDNPSYSQKAEEYGAILGDSMDLKPLDKATSSLEYVMRHKGAPFLRSPDKNLNIAQSLLLDVMAFLLIVTFAAFHLIKIFFSFIWRKMTLREKVKVI